MNNKPMKNNALSILIWGLLWISSPSLAEVSGHIQLKASNSEPNTIRFPAEVSDIAYSEDSGVIDTQLLANQVLMFQMDSSATNAFIINAFLIDGSFMSFRITPRQDAPALLFPKASMDTESVLSSPVPMFPSILSRKILALRVGEWDRESILMVNDADSSWMNLIGEMIQYRQVALLSDGVFNFWVFEVNNAHPTGSLEFDWFFSRRRAGG